MRARLNTQQMHETVMFWTKWGAERQVVRTHKTAMFNILVALSVLIPFHGKCCECCACQTKYFRIEILHLEMLKFRWFILLFTLWFLCCCCLIGWWVRWKTSISIYLYTLRYTIELHRIWNAHNHISGIRDEFRFWWENRNPPALPLGSLLPAKPV